MFQTLHQIDWSPLWLTLRVATLTTLRTGIRGMGLGWLFARTQLTGQLLEAVCVLPLVLKAASTAFGHFGQMDRTLEAAARTMRQSGWSTFWRVMRPAYTLLVIARAMGSFGASLMVAGSIPDQTQTVSMAIYDAVQGGHDDLALVLALVISALSVTILVASHRLRGGGAPHA